MTKRLLLKELSRYKSGTFADIIYRNALLYPDSDAFIYSNERLTHSQYNAIVNKVIHALLKMGVKKGQTVGLLSWNCIQAAVIYGVAMKGGFIASPFNPRLTANELEYIINYSETNIIFVGPELVDTINTLQPRLHRVRNYIILEGAADNMLTYRQLLESNPGHEPDITANEDDPIGIIYTSGTTGIPRGALYTQRCFIDDARTFAVNTGVKQRDRHLQVTPQFHIAGNTWFRTFMYAGACTIIHKFFNPAETLKTIQEEKATHMNIVPTQLVAMLNVPDFDQYDLSSMKLIWYGASPMPFEVLKKGLNIFGSVFGQGYGQSESGPAITHMTKEDHEAINKPGADLRHLISAGKPDIGVQVRIVDKNDNDCEPGVVGEIIVKSKHIMAGYWKKPEDTRNTIIDGWLHTGDMGYYDENGYIYIADRKKDIIITGGENVFPREVEEVLYQHPAIFEAAVIGIPDPYWVEKVHAIIVPRENATISEKEVISFCKERIAGYKTPKSIEFTAELPKNAAGKIVKKELRNKYWKDQTTN